MMIGKVLNDRYKLLQLIGGGGMSNVYLAHDIILDRDVAVKILRLELSSDDQFIKRFRREAHSVAGLMHPNIVEVYDVGEEDNIYYIVMEYIEGPTLKQYIQNKGKLSVLEAISFMLQLASAIEEAHRAEIVHRDIKPQNILLKDSNTLKITDFGIAVASTSTTITQTNAVLGSVHYLSPEQARGGIATKKSDIYSLGIVFYEMLAGVPPFSGESVVSIALKHLQNETPSIREVNEAVPQSVENIILKATTKDMFHRYNSVEEIINDLETALLPEKINEGKFSVSDDEEKTRAIPIIKNDDTLQYSPGPKQKPKESKEVISEEDDEKEAMDEEAQIPSKKGKKPDKPKEKTASKKNKSKKKRKSKLLLTVFILLLLVSAAIAAVTIVPDMLQPKDVTVPDVTNLKSEEAIVKLTDVGLKLGEIKEITSDTIEDGYIVKSSPEAEKVVKEGSKVTIYRSIGKQKGSVSNYVGENYYTLKDSLNSLYKDVVVSYVSSDETSGTIIEQSPNANEEVVEEDTTLELIVSEGPPKITVADFTDWTEKSVSDWANEKGLKFSSSTQYNDDVKEGLVISQSPKSGTEVTKGTSISVVISLGSDTPNYKESNIQTEVKYIENEENEAQKIEVYVNDRDNSFDKPIITKSIKEDTPLSFTVIVEEGKEASYKILRDGEVIIEEKVLY